MEFGPVCMSSRRKPFDVRAVESLLILLFKTGEIGRLAYRCPQPGKTSRENSRPTNVPLGTSTRPYAETLFFS
jgi:hypothetical protein